MQIRVDDDLKTAIKIRAAIEKITTKALVTRVMKDYLEKGDQKGKSENK